MLGFICAEKKNISAIFERSFALIWKNHGYMRDVLGPTTNITTVLWLLFLAGNSRLCSCLPLAFTAVNQRFQPFSFQIWTEVAPPPSEHPAQVTSTSAAATWLVSFPAGIFKLRLNLFHFIFYCFSNSICRIIVLNSNSMSDSKECLRKSFFNTFKCKEANWVIIKVLCYQALKWE